jgi:hypothetical protein
MLQYDTKGISSKYWISWAICVCIINLASYHVGSDLIPKCFSWLQFLLSFIFAEYAVLFSDSIWPAACKSHENNYVVHYPCCLLRMF